MRLSLKNYLVLALLVLMGSSLLGQGTPHSVYGTLEYNGGSVPTPECTKFKAFIVGGVDTLHYLPGEGDPTTCSFIDGIWFVQLSTIYFTVGDILRVEFQDVCDDCDHLYNSIDLAITSDAYQDFGLVTLDICFGIDESNLPVSNVLGVYPNPFNSAVAINLPDGNFDIAIYDVIGNLVTELGETQGSAIWTPSESSTTSGIYFVKVTDLEQNKTSIEKVIYQK